MGHRKQSCLLPSSDSCEDRRSACSLLGIASLRTGEKMDGTHCCVAFFCVMWTSSSFGEQRGALLSTGCPALPCLVSLSLWVSSVRPAWRAQMQEGSLEEDVLQKMSHFLV